MTTPDKAVYRACHRCERLRVEGGPWIIVELEGAYADRWEFCSIECLGSHFEVRPDLYADPREGNAR